MAPRARATAAEVEEENEGTASDPKDYVDKTITPAAQAFTEWLTDEAGYEADERSVYLAMSLRRKFQHDESTRTRIAEIRDERAAAKPAKAPKPAAEEPEEGEGDDAPAKPARGKAAAAAAKPTPATARRGGRPAARASDRPAGRGRGAAKAEAPF